MLTPGCMPVRGEDDGAHIHIVCLARAAVPLQAGAETEGAGPHFGGTLSALI